MTTPFNDAFNVPSAEAPDGDADAGLANRSAQEKT
jgi:hypothetical protein